MNRKLQRARRSLLFLVLALTLVVACGCQTLSYYTQAIRGQYQIVARQQPIDKLVADPQTPASLKEKIQFVQQLRAFAEKELSLPANGHYRRYADLHRPFAVWNVYAAPEFSLASKTWWYPFVGSLDYHGYFSESDARRYAARLRGRGLDVYVEGVEAYSTLGWFKDPVLNTFIHHRDPELAEIIFHELAHQRVFASGDTDFNEAFATCVGEEGVRRWLRAKSDPAMLENYLAALRRNGQFVGLITDTRKKLEALYADERTPDGRIKAGKKSRAMTPEKLRQQKLRILEELRRDYEPLKAQWGGYAGFDEWLEGDVNNARLNSVATYYDLVPAFEQLLQAKDGDLKSFYSAAKQLARLPKTERHQRLMDLERARPAEQAPVEP